MMERDKREKEIQETVKTIMQFPLEMQRAVLWLLENLDFVEEWTKMEVIPEDTLQELLEKAIAKKDYLMWLLLLWQKNSQK